MFKNQSKSNSLINAQIYFLPNRLHINLKEAIKILNKPLVTKSIECTQLEPKSDLFIYFIIMNQTKYQMESSGKKPGLLNKKNPMVIARYFSSDYLYKSVFKLIKKKKQ